MSLHSKNNPLYRHVTFPLVLIASGDVFLYVGFTFNMQCKQVLEAIKLGFVRECVEKASKRFQAKAKKKTRKKNRETVT